MRMGMRASVRTGAGIAALTACIGGACFAPGNLHAQTDGRAPDGWPTRPIRLIVPFPPGGSNDILGRIIATRLGERLAQQVVVDNRGGADGIIGADIVAKAQPDGYTLLVISTSFAINPSTHRIPYDPVKDFAAVTRIGSGPTVISAHPSFTAKDIRDLIALAKAKPGQIAYASSGLGGVIHLTGELFNLSAGVKLLHVPYRGGGPAAIDVVAGQVPLLISTVASGLAQLKAGKLKPLGVGSLKRAQLLPDVPTIAESGVPGFDSSVWWGILAPAKTPRVLLERIDAETGRAIAQPETRERLNAAGADELDRAGPDAFGRLVASEIDKWSKVAKQAGLKPGQ
jgi:tripartite-type tricarboxylate transporter receptor subunit TctC